MLHKDWAIACSLDPTVEHYHNMTSEEAQKLAVSYARLHHKRIIAELLLAGKVLARSEVITYPLVHAIARDGEMHAVFAAVGLLNGKGDPFVSIPVHAFSLELLKREWLMQANPDGTGRMIDWCDFAPVVEGATHHPALPSLEEQHADHDPELFLHGVQMEAEHPSQERVELPVIPQERVELPVIGA